jgi:cytochrome P450
MYEVEDLYTKFKNQHPYIGIFNFRSPRLLVFDPQLSRDILVKYFRQFQATEIYDKIDEKSDPLFGNHMFVLIGEKWKTKRQEMSPALTNSRVSN